MGINNLALILMLINGDKYGVRRKPHWQRATQVAHTGCQVLTGIQNMHFDPWLKKLTLTGKLAS